MTDQDLLARFMRSDEDELFTAALQVMTKIHDDVVRGLEEAIHADLPAAIEDLQLGGWRHLPCSSLVDRLPYPAACALLDWLLTRLIELASTSRGQEAAASTRWLLRPANHPSWAMG